MKHEIDTRGGYVQQAVEEAHDERDFVHECVAAYLSDVQISDSVAKSYRDEGLEVPQYLMSEIRSEGVEEPLLPDLKYKLDPEHREEYPEEHRSETAKKLDDRLDLVKEWLRDPDKRPDNMTD